MSDVQHNEHGANSPNSKPFPWEDEGNGSQARSGDRVIDKNTPVGLTLDNLAQLKSPDPVTSAGTTDTYSPVTPPETAQVEDPGVVVFRQEFAGTEFHLLEPLHPQVNYSFEVMPADPYTLELRADKWWLNQDGKIQGSSLTLDTHDHDRYDDTQNDIARETLLMERQNLLRIYTDQGLEAMMQEAEKLAVANLWLKADRADPRLFREGPEDRFQTWREQAINDREWIDLESPPWDKIRPMPPEEIAAWESHYDQVTEESEPVEWMPGVSDNRPEREMESPESLRARLSVMTTSHDPQPFYNHPEPQESRPASSNNPTGADGTAHIFEALHDYVGLAAEQNFPLSCQRFLDTVTEIDGLAMTVEDEEKLPIFGGPPDAGYLQEEDILDWGKRWDNSHPLPVPVIALSHDTPPLSAAQVAQLHEQIEAAMRQGAGTETPVGIASLTVEADVSDGLPEEGVSGLPEPNWQHIPGFTPAGSKGLYDKDNALYLMVGVEQLDATPDLPPARAILLTVGLDGNGDRQADVFPFQEGSEAGMLNASKTVYEAFKSNIWAGYHEADQRHEAFSQMFPDVAARWATAYATEPPIEVMEPAPSLDIDSPSMSPSPSFGLSL